MLLSLKDDAIFIADSHYNKQRIDLKNILDDILCKKIKTSQLFLMGDMFDFLCDEVTYFKKTNQKIIDTINKLSLEIQIIYLEGNHDFNLEKIFTKCLVVKRNNQPLIIEQNKKFIAVSHGDIFTPNIYNIFTSIMRNRFFLKLLNLMDINNNISKYFEEKLIVKNICHDFEDFNKFAQNRLNLYKKYDDLSLIIEGHYHQGKEYDKYINIPSLACGNFYSLVKIKEDKIILQHLQYS